MMSTKLANDLRPGEASQYSSRMASAGSVVGVHVNCDHSFSKSPKSDIQLIEGHGVDGDAHAGKLDQHLYHKKRYGAHPNLRQVHLIHAELFDAFADEGHAVSPGDLGENISTRGVALLGLPTGTRLKLGTDAVIELTGLRNPCHQIEDFQPGLLKHCKTVNGDHVIRKTGVMGIVLHSGIVRAGDHITTTLPSAPHKPLIYRVPGKQTSLS